MSSWRRRIVTTQSVELLNHLNRHTFTTVQRVVPLDTRTKFFFNRDQMDLGRISLVHVRCTPVQLEVLPSSHLILVVSEGGQSLYKGRGLEVASSRGDTAIIPNYGESLYQSSSDSRFAVQIAYDVIAELLETGHRAALRTRLNRPLQLDLSSPRAAYFRRAVKFIWGQSTPESEILRAAFDEVLLYGLLGLIGSALCDPTRLPDIAPHHVQRACEMIRARVSEPIRIAEIARELGISLRHLQSGFRRHLGATPHQFLRDCRLDQAHLMLSAPLPGETTTSIAYECGFAHLGDFARSYRSRFGEMPSETLRHSRSR